MLKGVPVLLGNYVLRIMGEQVSVTREACCVQVRPNQVAR